MSMSRTRTISSWSSAKTAPLITSAWVEIYLSVFERGNGCTRRAKKKKGVGGGVGV